MDRLRSKLASAKGLRPQAKRVLRPVLATAFYVLLSFGLEWLSNTTEAYPDMGPWRLPAGLALGLLLVYGFQYLPLAFAGQALATFWPGPTSVTGQQALLVAATTTLTYVLASLAIRRWIPEGHMDLLNPRHLYIFLLMAPATAVLTSSVTVANWWLVGLIPRDRIQSAIFEEAAANAAGILLMTPFALLLLASWIERLLDRLTGEKAPPVAATQFGIWKTVATMLCVAAATYVILSFTIVDHFALFCLISIPLIAVAFKYRLSGVTVALAVFGCLLTGTARLGYDVQNPLGIQLVVIASAVNALLLGSSVSSRYRQEGVTKRQAALLNSVSFATDQLLAMTDKEQNVSNVLEYLAAEANMTRTYVLENRPDLNSSTQPLYEHWGSKTPVDARHAQRLNVVLRQRIGEHAHSLSQGEVLQYRTVDLPEDEQAVLSALNIRASIVLPIFADGRWWGCLGMDQCWTDRLWSEPEISAFKATGRALAALLSHTNVEQQFRQLTGNIPAVFWIGAPDGLEKTYVSPAYEQIWGWPYESIQNNPRSWIAPVYHEDYARISAALPKQLLGEYDEEYRIVRSDRSVRWIRETAFPVRDTSGQVSRIVGIAQDITRQKEAEESLRATSLLLSSLIDNLHAGIVVEDHSRQVIHVNPAFCKMFDMAKPRESLLGMDSRVIFSPQTVWASRTDEIIREGKECRNEELVSDAGRVFNRDYFPLSVDADCHYHLWRYEDITDRKRSEEKVRTSLKEKEVLLKEIHHRVKNNLQVISSLLNLQATQIKDKETAQVFRDSQSRVKAMSLVHERLYQSSDLARIDFAGYVQDVTTHLLRSYQTGQRGIRLRVDVDPVSFNIDTAIPCALIINELVSNALKYAFPNGRDGEIRIRMNQINGDNLSLVISDNGVGFPTKFSWEQTDSLGLQLVRSLTDQLNGTVEYRNGKGSEFDIRFRPVSAESRN
jgi:PAS domain S-box-containing protein